MSPLDLAFLVGPLGAPIIGILVMVALVVARPAEWALWIGTPLFGLTSVAWLTYWLLWRKGVRPGRRRAGPDCRQRGGHERGHVGLRRWVHCPGGDGGSRLWVNSSSQNWRPLTFAPGGPPRKVWHRTP